jgi:hypothetical protein
VSDDEVEEGAHRIEQERLAIEKQRLEMERRRDTDSRRFGPRYAATITATVISVATIVFSIFQWKTSVDRANHDTETATKRTNRDYDLETYKLVVASFARKDSAEQYAALRLVRLVNDSALKDGLRDALERNGTSNIRREVNQSKVIERVFRKEDEQTLQRPDPRVRWRYDVFYCEGNDSSSSHASADRLAAILKGPGVAVRVRLLPTWINASSGYHAAGYEIRAEASEATEAQSIVARLDSVPEFRGKFALRTVGTATPQYVSLFVCP